MKSIIVHLVVAIALSTSSAGAFVLPRAAAAASAARGASSPLPMSKGPAITPEIEAAIADLRAAAAEFGEETAYFANGTFGFVDVISTWINKTIEGTGATTAAGLLDECLLDDDEGKCERFENALTKLDSLLGVGAAEQY
ncbi:hypothetical protein ACHAW5_001952 [Stephanodiscus triporus]|uniref:Uncharacterized protein n=1 Tax=Stephanodiscus triporus TaxID=2934178 RepID=A0ABD3MZ85_9STRA